MRVRLLVTVVMIIVLVAAGAGIFGLGGGSGPGREAAAQPSGPASSDVGPIAVREGDPPQAADEFVPGELIVQFDADSSLAAREASVTAEGAVLKRHMLLPGFTLVGVPQGQEEEFLNAFQANPSVRMVERNGIDRVTFTPNDPAYNLQWHLPQVQSQQAWDVADGSGVVVAVVDSGVAYENYGGFAQAPDLAGTSFTAGRDIVNNDAHPNDDYGHGTHVSGTIAQTTNNSLGVAGLAYGATIMPVKTLNSSGGGTHAQMADGYVWATDHGADVINYSAGGNHSTTKEAGVNYALTRGVVVVAAAGNDSVSTLGCPACYPGVIAVGATDYAMNRAPYSSYGTGLYGHTLDVVAPGGNTGADLNLDGFADGVLQQTYEYACLGGAPNYTTFTYCFWQGTSMATPHVTAAAALLLDANPSLTRQQVGDCLRYTALDRGTAGYDLQYGWGLIQVRDALDACSAADADGDGCSAAKEFYGAPGSQPGATCSAPSPCFSRSAWFDFYDVPVPANPDSTPNGLRDRAVGMDDVLATLFYFATFDGDAGDPTSNGVTYDSLKDGDWFNGAGQVMSPDGLVNQWDKVGRRYDRSPGPVPNPPWNAAPPDGAVGMDDVLVVLAQFGLDCSTP